MGVSTNTGKFRKDLKSNESLQMKIGLFGALFGLSLSIVILNSQCKEGAKYINVYLRTSISKRGLIIF